MINIFEYINAFFCTSSKVEFTNYDEIFNRFFSRLKPQLRKKSLILQADDFKKVCVATKHAIIDEMYDLNYDIIKVAGMGIMAKIATIMIIGIIIGIRAEANDMHRWRASIRGCLGTRRMIALSSLRSAIFVVVRASIKPNVGKITLNGALSTQEVKVQ